MEYSTLHQFSAMYAFSSNKGTPEHIREWLMSCQVDFHANHFQSQESEKEKTTNETCGLQPSKSFGRFNQSGVFLKTCPDSSAKGISKKSLVDWPHSGSMRSGQCWERTIVVHPIAESVCGFWPTPAARDWKGTGMRGQLPTVLGAVPNPAWIEWLMGWPEGASDFKLLEMDKYQLWLQQHSGF